MIKAIVSKVGEKMEKYAILKNYTLLCVEDDSVTLRYLEGVLSLFFKRVITSVNGDEAYRKLKSDDIDIIITDIYMPYKSGIDFIKKIRDENNEIPVVFISACSDTKSLLGVVPLHANSYLVKPIGVDVILETLYAAILKKTNTNFNILNNVEFNLKEQSCKKDNKIINLTRKEFELLALFVANYKLTLSKTFIENNLWKDTPVSESGVKTLIKKLRSKIGEDTITTISNIGYKIAVG
ncbi:MAG: response regulator transcription factor [Sulfuricurvum sp.]|nr:response regulator transcription factor [Sulfuricurvum sp.]